MDLAAAASRPNLRQLFRAACLPTVQAAALLVSQYSKCSADPPRLVNAFIEITPFDLMKYEVDKVSGYLRVDRPQRTSAQHPALYGFIPRTYCGERVCRLAAGAKRGDGDPLDICVISERAITRTEVILRCRVIGGLQMIDRGDA